MNLLPTGPWLPGGRESHGTTDLGIRLRDVAAALQGTLACSLGMGAAVAALARGLPEGLPAAASLLLQAACGVACYALFARGSGLAAYRDTVRTLRAQRDAGTAGDAPAGAERS